MDEMTSADRASLATHAAGLQMYNLSQPWGHHMPEWPSMPGVNVLVRKFHAKDGVYQTEFDGIMHRGTHMDAPLHVSENTPDISDYPLWRFFGTGNIPPFGDQVRRWHRPCHQHSGRHYMWDGLFRELLRRFHGQPSSK